MAKAKTNIIDRSTFFLKLQQKTRKAQDDRKRLEKLYRSGGKKK